MASFPAKKNAAYLFYIGLGSRSTGQLQNAPTIAAGDVKISKDGGSFNNLTNLPTVTPAAGRAVQVSLTASEMNADNVVIVFSDVVGDEWNDVLINIDTSIRQIDDLLYPSYQIPEVAASDGVAPTIEQAILMTCQFLSERVVAGTTVTVRKVDGATMFMQFTVNDAVNPTSITRSA